MYEQHDFPNVDLGDAAAELEALDAAFLPHAAPLVPPANPGFQLPRRLWLAMLACYVVFFGAIAIATGGSGAARFAIVISVLYTFVFFGVARIGARQAGPEARSPLDRGQSLSTWTGPMESRTVFAQVLIVPVVLALFAIGIAIICALSA